MSSYVSTINERFESAKAQVRTDPTAALKAVLEDMPVRPKKAYGSETDKNVRASMMKECQDAAAAAVCTTLCSIEAAKMGAAVAGLNEEERDTLMKFVYRAFSERTAEGKCTYDCNLLLKAHDEITKIAGNGPIIRSIHTRLEV